ncbi:MAG: hypothetical protein FJ318_08790 [SAR202 cluster bacterium]|nr:hypothetical protein [SAR202 cluster bacterium]
MTIANMKPESAGAASRARKPAPADLPASLAEATSDSLRALLQKMADDPDQSKAILARSRAARQQAETSLAQTERLAVEQTRAYTERLRRESEKRLERANALAEEAVAAKKAAEAERQKLEAMRGEAHRMRAEADAILKKAKDEAERLLLVERRRAENDNAEQFAQIEKLQVALKEELKAQKFYTMALRLRAESPTYEEFRDSFDASLHEKAAG